MSRKDYVLIAAAIKAADMTELSRRALVDVLCVSMKLDNPQFRADVFKEACGYA